MRVTKVMKDYVEKQMDEKRMVANKEYRATYEARRKDCTAEIKALVDEARRTADEILARYDMDTIESRRDSSGYYSNEVIRFFDQCIHNHKEFEEIRDHERKLYDYQKEALERFYLECDLGCDREKFFAMVEELGFEGI